MAISNETIYKELSENLYKQRKAIEQSYGDKDLYDFAGECFHNEIIATPENTHNSVNLNYSGFLSLGLPQST